MKSAKKEFTLLFISWTRYLPLLFFLALSLFIGIQFRHDIEFSLEQNEIVPFEGNYYSENLAICNEDELINGSIGSFDYRSKEECLDRFKRHYCERYFYNRHKFVDDIQNLEGLKQGIDNQQSDKLSRINDAILKRQKLMGSPKFFLTLRWFDFFSEFTSKSAFLPYIFVFIAAVFFSHTVCIEKSLHTTKLIWNTKNGKKSFLWSKFCALSIVLLLLALSSLLLSFTCTMLNSYQFEHRKLSVQDAFLRSFPFDVSLIGVLAIIVWFWCLAAILLTAYILLVSAVSRNSFESLLLATVVLVILPIALSAVGIRPLLFPSNLMTPYDFLFEKTLVQELSIKSGLYLTIFKYSLVPLIVSFAAYFLAKLIVRKSTV